MKLYIVSFLGSSEIVDARTKETRREKRKRVHQEQIEWAFENNLEPVVVAQEYEPEDYIEGVRYLGDNTRMTPSEARNMMLEEFYASDDEYAAFADNDSIMKNISTIDFIAELQANPSVLSFERFDLILPVNPITTPYNKPYQAKKEMYDSNLVFRPISQFKESFFFLSNLNKKYGKPLYFEVERFKLAGHDFKCGEGLYFFLDMLGEGWLPVTCVNILLHELDTRSTWNIGNDDEKYRIDETDADYIYKKHNVQIDDVSGYQYEYAGYVQAEEGKSIKFRKIRDKNSLAALQADQKEKDWHRFVYFALENSMTAQEMNETLPELYGKQDEIMLKFRVPAPETRRQINKLYPEFTRQIHIDDLRGSQNSFFNLFST